MNRNRFLEVCTALLILILGALATSRVIQAQSATQRIVSTGWEYRLLYVNGHTAQRDIDDLANQGFEMLDFKVIQPAGGEPYYHIMFKRPRR